jgi:16S rRNA (uracil1498-N3)-methyltransferase
MPAERYFIDSPFTPDATIILTGEEQHHLCTVMRTNLGETIELINGQNQLAEATVQSISKKTATLQITQVHSGPPLKQIILAQAIPRFNRLETILEKGTELGATAFWLFPSLHSEKKEFSENQIQRMRHILISAMKQCGRLDLPAIEFKPPLLSWKLCPGTLLYGDTRPDAPRMQQMTNSTIPLIFFIGPEKGFHSQETHFLQNNLHASGIKLHDNILRVDTAPLAALTLLNALI